MGEFADMEMEWEFEEFLDERFGTLNVDEPFGIDDEVDEIDGAVIHTNNLVFEYQAYITKSDKAWCVQFEEGGYVWNPQSGKHFTRELKDMNPAKLMNYMMQSLETSNNIIILKNILKYLRNKKSFITLYTYDAILFDFNKTIDYEK